MALQSLVEQPKPTGSTQDWVEWFLHRVQQEPWALGGAVVIIVFILGTLSIALFALLYGCCCRPVERKRRKPKTFKDAVI